MKYGGFVTHRIIGAQMEPLVVDRDTGLINKLLHVFLHCVLISSHTDSGPSKTDVINPDLLFDCQTTMAELLN